MPAKPLPLIQLGDHTKYDPYREKFAEIYDAATVADPLGRQLYLPPNAFEHVVLKPRSFERGFVSIAASWQQERAERLGWIISAIVDPDEIRPDHQYPKSGKEAYLLNVLPVATTRMPAEFYYVPVQTEKVSQTETRIILLSAYRIPRKYWLDARRGGKPLYVR
jgi:hypothetical protein